MGSRAAVDQGLTRLVKDGVLRRVGRGLYDWPRHSDVLDGPAPTNLNAVVDALKRRFDIDVVPSNLAAANAMGLTHAVPTRVEYLTTRKVRDVKVGSRKVRLVPAGTALAPWLNTPAAPVVQALFWLHDHHHQIDDDAIVSIRKKASPDARRVLDRDMHSLPGWAIPHARHIVENRATGV